MRRGLAALLCSGLLSTGCFETEFERNIDTCGLYERIEDAPKLRLGVFSNTQVANFSDSYVENIVNRVSRNLQGLTGVEVEFVSHHTYASDQVEEVPPGFSQWMEDHRDNPPHAIIHFSLFEPELPVYGRTGSGTGHEWEPPREGETCVNFMPRNPGTPERATISEDYSPVQILHVNAALGGLEASSYAYKNILAGTTVHELMHHYVVGDLLVRGSMESGHIEIDECRQLMGEERWAIAQRCSEGSFLSMEHYYNRICPIVYEEFISRIDNCEDP